MTGIPCHNCGRTTDHCVAYTEQAEAAIRRRRHCVCGHRFTTVEVVVTPKVAPFRLSTAGRFQ